MQLYSCDLDDLLDALEHMCSRLRLLAAGDDKHSVLLWTRQLWRDFMSAFMLVPVPRCIALKPSRPHMFNVRNPADYHNIVRIAMCHRQLWWSKDTVGGWELAVSHYTNSLLLLQNTLDGPPSRSPDGGADQRSSDEETRRSAAMLLRHAVVRQAVRPLRPGPIAALNASSSLPYSCR